MIDKASSEECKKHITDAIVDLIESTTLYVRPNAINIVHIECRPPQLNHFFALFPSLSV